MLRPLELPLDTGDYPAAIDDPLLPPLAAKTAGATETSGTDDLAWLSLTATGDQAPTARQIDLAICHLALVQPLQNPPQERRWL
jgi:hypothetical protein